MWLSVVFHFEQQVADLIGADPREIIFTSGATESNNMAIKVSLLYHFISALTPLFLLLFMIGWLEQWPAGRVHDSIALRILLLHFQKYLSIKFQHLSPWQVVSYNYIEWKSVAT